MHFYYLTIFLFFIPALFETSFPKMRGNIQYKNYLLTGVVIVFIIQMGLRWETGTDWIPYLDHFNYPLSISPWKEKPLCSVHRGYFHCAANFTHWDEGKRDGFRKPLHAGNLCCIFLCRTPHALSDPG